VVFTHFDWPESLPGLEADVEATGGAHWIAKVDLLDTDAVEHLVNGIIDRYGRLDILVNNIERGGWPAVHGAYIRDQWDLEMATTLRAKRWLFDSALPHLKAIRRRLCRQHLQHRRHHRPIRTGLLPVQRGVRGGQPRDFPVDRDMGAGGGTRCAGE
jgi:NAD(P)-dependent dehydrogenase (short-subunit alcohol dehydrogenase family)